MKRICRYLQVTKDKGVFLNPPKKLVVDCYSYAHFAGLWGHQNTQDIICYISTTGFVVTFSNFTLLWVSKIQTNIALSTLHSEYVAFYHSVR